MKLWISWRWLVIAVISELRDNVLHSACWSVSLLSLWRLVRLRLVKRWGFNLRHSESGNSQVLQASYCRVDDVLSDLGWIVGCRWSCSLDANSRLSSWAWEVSWVLYAWSQLFKRLCNWSHSISIVLMNNWQLIWSGQITPIVACFINWAASWPISAHALMGECWKSGSHEVSELASYRLCLRCLVDWPFTITRLWICWIVCSAWELPGAGWSTWPDSFLDRDCCL